MVDSCTKRAGMCCKNTWVPQVTNFWLQVTGKIHYSYKSGTQGFIVRNLWAPWKSHSWRTSAEECIHVHIDGWKDQYMNCGFCHCFMYKTKLIIELLVCTRSAQLWNCFRNVYHVHITSLILILIWTIYVHVCLIKQLGCDLA